MAMILIGIVSSAVLIGNRLYVATAGDELLPGWGQLGVVGLLVIAFLTDQIVTGRKYNAIVKERDDERVRTEKAEAFLRDKVTEMITESSVALRTVNDEILPFLREVRGQRAQDKER